MNRRYFLKVAGSTSVIVAAGGIGGCSVSGIPNSALAPWEVDPVTYPDPMRSALSYAILAPNPHNRQPWLVDLKGDDEAILHCDLERLLSETDPYNRQIVIGLGCFLELFSMAALDNGYSANITLFPKGQDSKHLDTRPIAHLKLTKNNELVKDDLFNYALKRHTNRNHHNMKKTVENSVLTTLEKAAYSDVILGSTGSGERLEALRVLTRDALTMEMLNPPTHKESIDLLRIGSSEIEVNPDGISIEGFLMNALNTLGIYTREKLADPQSQAFKGTLQGAKEMSMNTMGFLWIVTAGNARTDQIAAGRSFMRITLEVTKRGMAIQPASYSLQEFPVMRDHLRQTQEMLTSKPGERVQMLTRIGYAEPVEASPRWPLSTRIIST